MHGHTIVPAVEHHPNRIAVDTGAVRTGVLSCVVLEGNESMLLDRGAEAAAGGDGGLARGAWRSLWLRR